MMRTAGRYPDGKILLVERDPDSIERIVAALAARFEAQITCVADAGLKSHVTLSPTAISISQSPLWNDESQNQKLPTSMTTVAALAGVAG